MKRFSKYSALILLSLALACPQVESRGRNNHSNNNQTEQRKPQNNSNRPGNNGHRPGGNNHNQSNRPGNNGHRPGGTSRPDHPQFNYGSSHNRPQPAPGNRPSYNHGPHHNFKPGPPPHRPHYPIHHKPWHRPTPPPAFRPSPHWRPFNSILGVALGSAINFSINALINSGYNVSGYGNNAVYVTNVPMLNMMWPDATLYYGNGGLCGSEFVYSSPAYNLNRYNSVYNSLIATYGRPISVSNANGVMTSTWWGSGNQYINLSFSSGIATNGATRFFTTLSFGN